MQDIKIQQAYMAVKLLETYYETNPTGGCLHVVTDDGNYGERFLQSCLDDAVLTGDFWAEEIARLLLLFNEEEQEQICERGWEIYMLMFPERYDAQEVKSITIEMRKPAQD